VPEIQQQILRSIFFDGKTQREIAFDIGRSAGCIAQNKTKAITTLKRVHGGEMVSARRIMRGTEVFEPEKIKSFWDQKLSHQIKDQRSYDQLNANQELLNHCVADIREIFQKLSELSRQIIYLKFWCELSTSEIARILSIKS
jgi:DNA-directed RNA polymerase specialized sigma subunit